MRAHPESWDCWMQYVSKRRPRPLLRCGALTNTVCKTEGGSEKKKRKELKGVVVSDGCEVWCDVMSLKRKGKGNGLNVTYNPPRRRPCRSRCYKQSTRQRLRRVSRYRVGRALLKRRGKAGVVFQSRLFCSLRLFALELEVGFQKWPTQKP